MLVPRDFSVGAHSQPKLGARCPGWPRRHVYPLQRNKRQEPGWILVSYPQSLLSSMGFVYYLPRTTSQPCPALPVVFLLNSLTNGSLSLWVTAILHIRCSHHDSQQ